MRKAKQTQAEEPLEKTQEQPQAEEPLEKTQEQPQAEEPRPYRVWGHDNGCEVRQYEDGSLERIPIQ